METLVHFVLLNPDGIFVFFVESSKEQHFFEIKIYNYGFTFTFNRFIVLVNKSMNFFQYISDLKLLKIAL